MKRALAFQFIAGCLVVCIIVVDHYNGVLRPGLSESEKANAMDFETNFSRQVGWPI